MRSYRFGLRVRVAAAFAAGALLLSVALAVLTYGFSASYLYRQRKSVAVRQATFNARGTARTIHDGGDVASFVRAVNAEVPSDPLVFAKGHWYSGASTFRPAGVPPDLRPGPLAADPSTQTKRLPNRLVVAVPLPSIAGVYYEEFSLELLSHTLGVLRNSLIAAGVATTLAGAVLGWVVSVRVLRPVRAIARAADRIATGELDTRLHVLDDPDLASVVTAFNSMTSALASRIEREQRFAASVSHELRSPLTTLAASVEVLHTRRGELSERGRAALDLLTLEVERFQRIVTDLLEISRLDANAAALDLEDLHVGELVLHALNNALPSFGAPIEVDEGALDAIVRGDKRRMERLVVNLVENADRHGGGVSAVRVERADAAIRLVVEDHGPGVAPEDRTRIFDRFERGRPGRRQGTGAGLGLSIVAEHVRLHDGRVWVEDADGGGARFVVELPVAAEQIA